MRLLVTGGVNTGKSLLVPALAARLNAPYRYTDEALAIAGGDWHQATLCVANWLLEPGPWIIAGVRLPWALLHLLRPLAGSAREASSAERRGPGEAANSDSQLHASPARSLSPRLGARASPRQQHYALPPIIYLTRALSLETIAQAKMTKSVDAGWQQLQAIVRIRPLYKGPYHAQLCDNICKELQPCLRPQKS